MTIRCLICKTKTLNEVYSPKGTLRGAIVHVCGHCGLIQSTFETQVGDGRPRISHNAPYGNIRIGKIGRENHVLKTLSEWQSTPPRSFLDVGASRGLLCWVAANTWPDCRVVGVEPDEGVVSGHLTDRGGKYRIRHIRIEEFPLGEAKWDRITLLHTLEHLPNPLGQLKRLAEALTPEAGLLYIEVPDTEEVMGIGDIVEECYLDKHYSHFTKRTLRTIIEAAGLRVLTGGTDGENLWAVAARGHTVAPQPGAEPALARLHIREYAGRLERNRGRLRAAIPKLEAALGKVAVVWGIGRLFSALVGAGLDPARFEFGIDSYLNLDEVYGLPVMRPRFLEGKSFDAVLVCSRSAAAEIGAEAARLLPEAEIFYWKDILSKELDNG